MNFKVVTLLCCSVLLVSCSGIPVKKQAINFNIDEQSKLYEQESWSFSGRFALSTLSDSVSASIKWEHSMEKDEIELSGPFGQGRTRVTLVANAIEIDSGDQKAQYFGQVDELVSRYLGIDVPVSALKYWVLGLVDVNRQYTPTNNGFVQSGWQVQYQSMQSVGGYNLPKKIKVENSVTQFKLILNKWDIQ